MVKPFISSLLSVIACIYSAFGVVLLTILGLCYQSKDPQFFHTRPLSEADTAALNCFLSALIFLVLFSFSYWQYYLNARMTPISQSAKAKKQGSSSNSILMSPPDQQMQKSAFPGYPESVYSFATAGNMAYNNRKSP